MAEYPLPETDTEKLRVRNQELSILNTIAEALNREIDLSQALKTALTQVTQLLNLQTGWIFLRNQDTDAWYLAASLNLPPALESAPERMRGRCYCLDAYQDGDLDGAANVNVITCTRLSNLDTGTKGLRYHASIPLYAQGKELGVFNVVSADWQKMSPERLQLLYTVGDLMSIAIERARLFEQSTQLGVVEERNRLAREIHDTIAQSLTAISLKLEAADVLLEAEESLGQTRQLVQQALTLTRTNLDEVRRSVLDLRAAPLEGRTLSEALALLTNEVAKQHDLTIIFEEALANQPIPSRVEVSLYRITQEALNNIVQHAKASIVTISVTAHHEVAVLRVEDDGQGFDPNQLQQKRFGLVGINERAKLIGGQFHIESNIGLGTRLEVKVPLSE
ncbi:MAG: GAF domain-containing sensor histidine kinase [Chloroflexota bacterium]